MIKNTGLELWGGIESSYLRVGDRIVDQLSLWNGKLSEKTMYDLVTSLGFDKVRVPMLFKQSNPYVCNHVSCLRERGGNDKYQHVKNHSETIAGFIHHGSGGKYWDFTYEDGRFERQVIAYSECIAKNYPGIQLYNLINEPLTTARMSGLYGKWWPHSTDSKMFYKILLTECRAIVLGMRAIKKINPTAQLIQTEDLSKTYTTPSLQYQADFENERRWLSYDLLTGSLKRDSPLFHHMLHSGIEEREILWFEDNFCVPDIMGWNYYLNSERFLDGLWCDFNNRSGGNGIHEYDDRDLFSVQQGLKGEKYFLPTQYGCAHLLREAWGRYHLPMAITECHLNGEPTEQIRWFQNILNDVIKVKEEGVDMRAVTAWAIFGLYGWKDLCVNGLTDYEPGVFDMTDGTPKETIYTEYIRSLTK